METIDYRIEAWKNKLLDLGKRNRLLNYRDTKRSNLRIKKPTIFELWGSLIEKEETLEFPYFDDDQLSIAESNEDEGFEAIVITNQTIKEQQKTLRSLREKAKTAMEEQGVNILYLSFGFLRWREDDRSDQYLLSPIILVPVTLTLESINSPFVLGLHEDEVTLNPTLLHKLSNDFGINLPEFDIDNNIENYLNEIDRMLKGNKWEVVYETGLSLLSFLKINMYRDLEVHKDKIKANPIVRALSGDKTAISNIYEDINDYDHDLRASPTDVFQVVDADSSQQDAIVLAKKGISFVLQGPPGTGKSQTITNIIAESLASGKKVLFVSEKMAALEVVRKRLTTAGLADFCLSLHSYKANKKEVLEQLSVSLDLSERRVRLSDEAFQKLDLLQENKEKLNEYARQVFEVVEPFGKSIYQINGYLAHLESYDNIVFNIDDITGITTQKFNRYINILTQFASTIGKMSSDYKENPWYGANIPVLTNELIHNIGAIFPRLLTEVKKLSDICNEISTELCLDGFITYEGTKKLVEILAIGAKSPKAPVDWIIGDGMAHLWDEVGKQEVIKRNYEQLQHELSRIISKLPENTSNQQLSDPLLWTSTNQIINESEKLNQIVSNDYCFSTWDEGHFAKAQTLYEEALKNTQLILEIRKDLTVIYEHELFDIDYKGMLTRFKSEYGSVFKIFNSQYRKDKMKIRGLRRQVVKKISDNEITSLLMSLKQMDDASRILQEHHQSLVFCFGERYISEKTDFESLLQLMNDYENIQRYKEKITQLHDYAKEIETKEYELKKCFNFLYNGIETDWQGVIRSLTWANEFRDLYHLFGIRDKFVGFACMDEAKISSCSKYLYDLTESMSTLDVDILWYFNLFEEKDELKKEAISVLYDRIRDSMDNLTSLEEWIDFRESRQKCKEEGLANYIAEVERLNVKADCIIPVFKKRFYHLWLDAILPNYPAVLSFRRRIHEQIIGEFTHLDELQFDIARARIKKKLIDALPSFDRITSGIDELNILKRELAKQRRIMPIRKLFRTIPHLLLTLKPCLMMSPLSVSLFLEAESYNFDTIIFDEASQVCTENAIGAISRGKQVIIAGDSKQLPPTSFFNASTFDAGYDSEDEEEFDDTNAYESILDEAVLLPERTLLWHYRSRHEHLIAFSNAKIYRNNLITFPSNVENVPDNGVEYIYVPEGFYDRGGREGNMIEAKHVALLVFEHIRKSPNRSLGVIAFGEIQQQSIDTAIRQMRKENQQCETFFNEDNEEAFFIKNLENVQGDERDTIIFSIGYAKDNAGKLSMNFGPLNRAGGERRLNVAITRAKFNVKLVGSLLPTDIDVERISSEGPKLLRSYIDFAINGPSTIIKETTESDVVEHDSPFEAAVYNFLDRKGYKLGTQVGCSGYRIDMAVKHPSINGRYVIGIECDGAAYHSARTARERDRLRQAVLEDMGWVIYRIWSTDWIKDPKNEGQKLVDAIEHAVSEYTEEIEYNNQQPESTEKVSFANIDKREINLQDVENPYRLGKQLQTNFSGLPRDVEGYLRLEDCITATVENEFPLHYEVLCKNLAPLFGNEKATIKIRRHVDYSLETLKDVVRKGDFFYPANYKTITPRAVGNTRPIDHISVDELAEAMFLIVSKSFGIMEESLLQSVAREYGFARSGEKIQKAMQKAYKKLMNSGRIRETEGKVVVI